jgi:hypothetical protein
LQGLIHLCVSNIHGAGLMMRVSTTEHDWPTY